MSSSLQSFLQSEPPRELSLICDPFVLVVGTRKKLQSPQRPTSIPFRGLSLIESTTMAAEGETIAPLEGGASDSNTQLKVESDPEPSNGDKVIGSSFLKPVFIGNLHSDYNTDDVMEIFERPILPDSVKDEMGPVGVDRVDMKRGYCFVFLKDVKTQSEKEHAERFVEVINGM